jgi:hypothetical protein
MKKRHSRASTILLVTFISMMLAACGGAESETKSTENASVDAATNSVLAEFRKRAAAEDQEMATWRSDINSNEGMRANAEVLIRTMLTTP